jgi:poly-gamma-glutamate synthesis protein (capsule biosynthesis protein)
MRLLAGKERDNFEARLAGLNRVIADDKALQERFAAYCESRKDIYNIYLEPYRSNWLASLRKRKWIPSVFSAQKRRLILNITRCESHRDVLFKYLED